MATIIAQNVIIKIQIPLAGEPVVMMNTEGRAFVGYFPYTKELRKQLKPYMQGEPKAYAYGNVIEERGQELFELNEVAPWQDW
jgi:hypothetical protein